MVTRQDRYAGGYYDRPSCDETKVKDPYWTSTHGYTRRGNLSWFIYRLPMWPIAIAMVFWLMVGLTIVVWSSLPAHADEDQMVCNPIDGGHGGWICITPHHHDDDEDGD